MYNKYVTIQVDLHTIRFDNIISNQLKVQFVKIPGLNQYFKMCDIHNVQVM